MTVDLSERDLAILSGSAGDGARMAMDLVVKVAETVDAPRLIDITSAHVDGCLYTGEAAVDFAERLASRGARVVVPTTLNTGSIDLLHPELFRGEPRTATRARRLMDLYTEMGCRPTWTCAPYQLPERPSPGDQVAWAESNAIVFVNSVVGARTNRYGDFIDICAAVTGRVPDYGLHRTENRRGQVVFRVQHLPRAMREADVFYPVLGHLVGREAGRQIPVIEGLPHTTREDQLKALGAAAATAGSVGLFHAVGVTPEAPSLSAALQEEEPQAIVEVDPATLRGARDALTTAEGGLAAVSLGTPHFSVAEFDALQTVMSGVRIHPDVEFYVSTNRHVLREVDARGWLAPLQEAGVQVVVDTCTYISPIIRSSAGVVMTNSAKWAYYAPGNLGVEVAFGSLEECVRSAATGRIWRDERLWAGL